MKLIMYSTEKCSYCKVMEPWARGMFPEMETKKLVASSPEIEKYNLQSVPCFLVFDDIGNCVARLSGGRAKKELREFLVEHKVIT